MTNTERAPETAIDDRSAALIRDGLSLAAEAALEADSSGPTPAGPYSDRRQAPLLFWLAHVLRPSTTLGVQLRRAGTYFALCMGLSRLDIASRAWGFGSWSGEDDTALHPALPVPALPRSALPPALRDRNAREFPQISRLTRLEGAEAALARFEPGMFDLILIDAAADSGPESAASPDALADRLATATSSRGAVLVLGLAEPGVGGAAAQALAAALAARHPVLPFPGNGGLVLALTGARAVPPLAALARPRAAADLAALQERLAALAGPEAGESPASADLPDMAEMDADPPQAELTEAEPAEADLAPPAVEPAGDAPPATVSETLSGTGQEALAEAPAPAAAEEAANPALLAGLQAAQDRLAEGHALRLRETRVLTAELERLAEALREERLAGEAGVRAAEALAADALAAREAELTALRIRQFDEGESLRGEIAWLERAAEEARAAAEARLAAELAGETARLAALHEARTADLAAELTAELATERQLAAGRIAAGKKTATRLQQEVDRLRAEAAERERLRQVQLKLRDWQLAWVTGKSRLGKRAGPSGGAFAEELAAVEKSPLFDAGWYRSAHPDLQDSPLPPAEHFLRHGLFEGRNPGPAFRTLAWFAEHPEALDSRQNPLLDPAAG